VGRAAAGRSIVVIGGGAFGLVTALELRARGHAVEVVDPGPIPHPQASSTDISKAVRMDYGRDGFYSDLAARALDGWREWDRARERRLFHEVGILLVTRGLMVPGSFEAESYARMEERGVPVVRLNAAALARRFPAWSRAGYADGYYNPKAGWVASGEAVARLAARARRGGVLLREGATVARLLERETRVVGVVLNGGEELNAEQVVVAAGAWTPRLLPHLAPLMWPVGQPVIHLRPADPLPFEGERFPVWCAEIATTGWYGFPVTRDGILKLGNHGPGREVAPGEPLVPNEQERGRAREFFERAFPDALPAPIAGGRICLYCDTWDGNFLIDHDPDRPGLVVAAGGSGHAFKFAPVLGQIVADVVERRPNPWAGRFAWRRPGPRATEHARHLD